MTRANPMPGQTTLVLQWEDGTELEVDVPVTVATTLVDVLTNDGVQPVGIYNAVTVSISPLVERWLATTLVSRQMARKERDV